MNLKRINWKTVLIGIGAILVLALIIQSCRVVRAERARAGDKAAVVVAQANEKTAKDNEAKAKAAQKVSDDLAKQTTDEANRNIAAKERERAAEHAKLVTALAQIKTLTGDQLAAEIGFRIGELEIMAVQAGGFSLTRKGGESTLAVFKTGEQTARDLATEKALRVEDASKLVACSGKVAARDETIKAKDTTIGGLEGTVDAMGDQIHDLELSRVKRFWTGFFEGTLFGAAVVAGLKLFGIWK